MSFAHLHNHTIFSALDGVGTPEQYAKRCKELSYPAMAITEHGHMASVPDVYQAFQKYGVKAIYGCEIYLNDWEPMRQKMVAQGVKIRSPDWRKENIELADRIIRNRHLTVLCKNETGYHNLIKLTTQAYADGLFGMGVRQFNRIWFDRLCEYKEGLIILSGCLNGPICHELRLKQVKNREGEVVRVREDSEMIQDAVNYIRKFKAAFGDDYYIELQMPGVENDVAVFKRLVLLADYFKIKLVLANDIHYLRREDYILQKIMMAVAQETTVDSPDLFHVNSDEQYFKTREELQARFLAHYSEGLDIKVFETACDNTLEIADKCEPLTIDSSPKIPAVENDDNILRTLVAQRLNKLQLNKVTKKYPMDGKEVTYVEQAKIELDRFIDKGFANYLLITRDVLQFGASNGWLFGPRGSAGGSLVCYLLGIHALDPLKWKLSFSRFLSPSRGGYLLNVRMDN